MLSHPGMYRNGSVENQVEYALHSIEGVEVFVYRAELGYAKTKALLLCNIIDSQKLLIMDGKCTHIALNHIKIKIITTFYMSLDF